MKANVGGIDRILRIVVGIVLIALCFFPADPETGYGPLWWWGLIGIVPLFTGAIGWCPAYLPFGISTCKTK